LRVNVRARVSGCETTSSSAAPLRRCRGFQRAWFQKREAEANTCHLRTATLPLMDVTTRTPGGKGSQRD
jgi:hypothetical protein